MDLGVPAMLEPGARLDRYELLCLLAQGGMANVWLTRVASRHGARKLFAIKTILPHVVDDPSFKAMFLDEAKIASRILHPNVVRMVDVGESASTPYQVMELIEGQPLHRLVRTCERLNRRMPLGIQLRILGDACAGLHAAHEVCDDQGRPLEIVHRDVSPQNLLLSTSGVTKVIDFGVAKAIDRAAGQTNAGVLKGKVSYMPHEQASGHDVDRRTDTWALGAVLYWMLAGRAPYKEEAGELATLRRAMQAPPIPPLPDTIPLPLSKLVMRALARDQADRFQTAAELGDAIHALTQTLGIAVAHGDVGQFVCQVMAEELEAQRQRIRQAISEATKREQASSTFGAVFDDDTTDETPRPSYEALIAMTRRESEGRLARAIEAVAGGAIAVEAATIRIPREANPHILPKLAPLVTPAQPIPIEAAPISQPAPLTPIMVPPVAPPSPGIAFAPSPVAPSAPMMAAAIPPPPPSTRDVPPELAPTSPPDGTAGALVVSDRPSLRPTTTSSKRPLVIVGAFLAATLAGLALFQLRADGRASAGARTDGREVVGTPQPTGSSPPIEVRTDVASAAPPVASQAPQAPPAPVPPPPDETAPPAASVASTRAPTETIPAKPSTPQVAAPVVRAPSPVVVRKPSPTKKSRDDEPGF